MNDGLARSGGTRIVAPEPTPPSIRAVKGIAMPGPAILSVQLYTLRALGDLDLVLDTVAQAGFRTVETIGGHLENPCQTRAKLDARGLSAPTSHIGLAALRDNFDATVAACRAIGIGQLFMPAVPQEQRGMDGAGWTALGRELGEFARRLNDQGVGLGYHNHDWELQPKAGGTALELLFAAAAGSPLIWQVDVAWLVRGGADPKQWMSRYRPLVVSAHLKDIAPAGKNIDQDGWADVGAGVLDWRDLWRACRDAGAAWMVVEHDKPADPAQSVRASFAFLKDIM
jgi:sugar phosphate isomerase/epimerase